MKGRWVGSLALAGVDATRSRALFGSVVDPDTGRLAALPHDVAWMAGVLSLGRAAAALAGLTALTGDTSGARHFADLAARRQESLAG